MIEGKKESDHEDLSEFSDYLSEFDNVINYDSETCPICGVNLSDSLAIQKSPYVVYKSFKKESELVPLTEKLQSMNIPFKVEKKLNSEVISSIEYLIDVLIPLRILNELEKKEN
jgi:hypothetical protein